MDENGLRKELAELEQKIAELPVEYISKRQSRERSDIICNGRKTERRKANMLTKR